MNLVFEFENTWSEIYVMDTIKQPPSYINVTKFNSKFKKFPPLPPPLLFSFFVWRVEHKHGATWLLIV